MNTLTTSHPTPVDTAVRAIVHRTRGHQHGPVIRLMSPPDLGEVLKPFVFLDRVDVANLQGRKVEGFGLHPHSGIATLTWLYEGAANYEDNMGRRGKLNPRWVEWMHAGKGAWHGGNFGDADRLRGFQLWVALPADSELGEPYSSYIGPDDLSTEGPVTVLLGRHGSASRPIRPLLPDQPQGRRKLDLHAGHGPHRGLGRRQPRPAARTATNRDRRTGGVRGRQ